MEGFVRPEDAFERGQSICCGKRENSERLQFSPHEVHVNTSFFGWILPTLRTSEYAVLQLVGLDAVVVSFCTQKTRKLNAEKLLSFLKLGFYFFTICAVLGSAVLMPINWREYGTIDGVAPVLEPGDHPKKGSNLFLTSHLIFTYAFSLIALYMLHRAYNTFVNSKQLFGLDHAHSIPARTVLITRVPPHLRGERQLAEYFENVRHSPLPFETLTEQDRRSSTCRKRQRRQRNSGPRRFTCNANGSAQTARNSVDFLCGKSCSTSGPIRP